MRSGRLIEGFYDCQYCGTKRIRGGLSNCPNCGKQRGTGTRFYMDSSNINYVDSDKAKTISRQPDWLCSFCDQLNSATLSNCSSCGASKDDSEKNYFDMKNEEDFSKDFSFDVGSGMGSSKDSSSGMRDGWVFSKYNSFRMGILNFLTSFVMKFNKNLLLKLSAVFGAILFLVLFIFMLIPREDTLTINELKWKRSISIEEERTVSESGWSVPSRGRVYKTKNEIHHYDSVIDHYETVEETKTREVIDRYEDYVSGYRDLGNGYFEEIISSRPVYRTETYIETRQKPVYIQVPIYKTKYYYKIDKWFVCRSVDTSGSDKEIYWGTVTLKDGEREGSKSESFVIVAKNKKDKTVSYNIDFDRWSSLNVGDVVNVKINLLGGIDFID